MVQLQSSIDIPIMELADSSINFVVRPWVKNTDYWLLYLDLNER
jgi:small conductance mechanosensitive channel